MHQPGGHIHVFSFSRFLPASLLESCPPWLQRTVRYNKTSGQCFTCCLTVFELCTVCWKIKTYIWCLIHSSTEVFLLARDMPTYTFKERGEQVLLKLDVTKYPKRLKDHTSYMASSMPESLFVCTKDNPSCKQKQ